MQIRVLLGTPPIFTEAERLCHEAFREVVRAENRVPNEAFGEGGRKARRVVFVIAHKARLKYHQRIKL